MATEQRTRTQKRVAGAPRSADADRVTILMVAQAAGVSAPTVSKVLNGRETVGSETRRRVQDALISTGYQRGRRSEAARSGVVDFVITELDTAWACELLRGAEQEAYRLGTSLILTVTHDRQAQPREWLKTLASRPTDGVVLVVTNTRQVSAEKADARSTPPSSSSTRSADTTATSRPSGPPTGRAVSPPRNTSPGWAIAESA